MGVGGVAAGDEAADVGLVGDGAGEALQLVLGEDGLDDVHVGEVDAARGVRVVHDVDVVGVDSSVELAEDGADGAGEGADVKGDGEAHGDGLAVAVGESGGEVHGVLDDAGVGGAEDGEGHLVDKGVEGVSDDLEGDGFYVSGQHGVSFLPYFCPYLNGRPERRPVITPSRRTGWPLTMTCSIPVASRLGDSRVPVSRNSLGSNMAISAFMPSARRPRSVRPMRAAGQRCEFLDGLFECEVLCLCYKSMEEPRGPGVCAEEVGAGEGAVHAEGGGVGADGAQGMEEGVAKLVLGVGVAEHHRVLDVVGLAGEDVDDGVPAVRAVGCEVGDALADGFGSGGGFEEVDVFPAAEREAGYEAGVFSDLLAERVIGEKRPAFGRALVQERRRKGHAEVGDAVQPRVGVEGNVEAIVVGGSRPR